MKKAMVLTMVGALSLALMGCTTTDQHTGAGALTGAVLGTLITGDASGALVGGAIGGVVGNVHGQNMEGQERIQANQARTQAEIQQMRLAQSQMTIWITNSNGSRTPVTMTSTAGGQWIGPRGEVYAGVPSEEQLRPVYGF